MKLVSIVVAYLALLAAPAAAQLTSVPTGNRAPANPLPSPLQTLVNSPSSMVVTQVGSAQQLRVFLESPGVQTEVTGDPGTSYQSSNPAVVAVAAGGLMSFVGQGQAQVTSSHAGLSAQTFVDVDPNGMAMVAAPVGTAGGSVHMADGTGVTIPPGALSAQQTIAVSEVALPGGTTMPPGSTLVSQAYDFTPSGLTFGAPVSLSLAYDPMSVPGTHDPESVLVHLLGPGDVLGIEAYTGPDGDEQEVESVNQALDPAQGLVTAPVRHFSCRAALASLNPVPVTLTAPDGTRLQVLRLLKTEKPGKGADGKYGKPNCDDDGNGQIDDCGEFELAKPSCTGTTDDVAMPLDTRVSADITHIVLHSTAGVPGTRFSGEVSWAANRRNCYWAQYYVGKDGTIVQISQDTTIAQHIKPNTTPAHAGNGIDNDNAIGIEIYSNTDVDNYPGRQVAAVVRLVDFLLRAHPTIARPTMADPDGNVITHAAQNPPNSVKTDPHENFRTAVMGSPSLETVVLRALRTDTITGIVNARGGDANGAGLPGEGGTVVLEMGVTALANDFDDNRASTQVAAAATQAVGGGDLMHLLVDGTATFAQDTALDLDGILYVGPDGVLDARGGFDGGLGWRLDVESDGFVFIEGRVLVNGTDKLGSNELAPWTQPPFAGGSGAGDGGMGGEFRFRSAAPGFLWVPTIVTRGGDGDSGLSGVPIPGGAGGDVIVRGNANANADDVIVLVRGHANAPVAREHEIGMPDYLPQPAPFNLMPIITATPIPSGTCPVDPFSNTVWLRPLSGERLALGRQIDPMTRVVGSNISLVTRGIVTCGGMGAVAPTTSDLSGDGGSGGDVTIQNLTGGYVRFLDGVQIVTGAGAERIASVITVAGGGCGASKFFDLPSGGMGGRGPFSGGDGGNGGAGGSIAISGRLWPNIAAPIPPPSIGTVTVMGFHLDNPNFSGGQPIGAIKTYVQEGFSTNSTRGSGGSPAGHASSFPGSFGLAGTNGVTTVNGAQTYP